MPEAGGPPSRPGLCLSLSCRLGPPVSAPGPGATCAAWVAWGSASGSGSSRAASPGWGRGQEAQVQAGNSRRSPNPSCPELSGRESVLSLLNKHVMNLKVRAENCPRRKNSHLATESAPSSPRLVPSLVLPEAGAPPPSPPSRGFPRWPSVGAGLGAPGVWEWGLDGGPENETPH